jgi:hypothetical protein
MMTIFSYRLVRVTRHFEAGYFEILALIINTIASGIAKNFWVLCNFSAKLFWGLGSHGQSKVNWATVFKTSYLFKASVYRRKKSTIFGHYLTKVFFDFKVFIIFRVKTISIAIFFYGVTQVGSWLRSSRGVRSCPP